MLSIEVRKLLGPAHVTLNYQQPNDFILYVSRKKKLTVDIENLVGVHGRSRKFLKFIFAIVAITSKIADALWLAVCDKRVILLRPAVLDLRQTTLQHLHEAVAVSVVVNRRGLPFVPA